MLYGSIYTSANLWAFQVVQWVKNPPAMQEMQVTGSVPGLGRSPGERHGYPLQYSCLDRGKDMDRGGWWATVHRVTVSDMTEATENACKQTNL